MQLGDKTAFGIGGIGLSAAAIGMTVEHVFPGAAPWIWDAIFWFGITLLILSVVFLVYLHFDWRRRLAPLLLMMVGGLMFFVGASWYGLTFVSPPTSRNGERETNGKNRGLAEFEKITGWSVSFTVPGLFTWSPGRPGDASFPSFVLAHRCQFTNISTSVRRIIDLKIVIPTNDPEMSTVTLDTHATDFQSYKNSLERAGIDMTASAVGRRNTLLNNPIVLEPSSFVEGAVEFEPGLDLVKKIREEPMVTKWLRLENGVVYATEQVSGRTIGPIKIGQKYDARTGITVKYDTSAP
jgi:hypothetical protein